ncbi:MAG: hypothetical protein HQ513_14490 [Rhodospirillales bacterium]|nr:hypothetical protein [Rhodospirillales bacterium]
MSDATDTTTTTTTTVGPGLAVRETQTALVAVSMALGLYIYVRGFIPAGESALVYAQQWLGPSAGIFIFFWGVICYSAAGCLLDFFGFVPRRSFAGIRRANSYLVSASQMLGLAISFWAYMESIESYSVDVANVAAKKLFLEQVSLAISSTLVGATTALTSYTILHCLPSDGPGEDR